MTCELCEGLPECIAFDYNSWYLALIYMYGTWNLRSIKEMASEMATKASEANGQFFKLAPAWNWVSVIAVITIIEISVYQPNLLPCDSLGYLGERFCHMVEKYHSTLEIGFWILIFIHVLEAIYAGQVCRELNLETKAKIKWILQTFVVGMFSLKFLIKERKHIKQN